MNVGAREVSGVTIVDLRGDLVAGVGDEVLRDEVKRLLAGNCRDILLNLSGVGRMDSAGVGELVASWKMAGRLGARLKLLRPGDRVRSTLHLAQVLPLLEVFEDEAEAVRSFDLEA